MELSVLEKEVELLRKKVKLLEELRELRAKESELQRPRVPPPPPPASPNQLIPFFPYQPLLEFCRQGLHDFPNPWYNTNPPACRRCGTPSERVQWITVTNATSGMSQKIQSHTDVFSESNLN